MESEDLTPFFHNWAILEEYDNTGARVQGYVQGYHGLVKTLVDNIYYYQDELGSTSHIADTSGVLLEYYKYDLYGKPTYFVPDSPNPQSASVFHVVDLGNGGSRWMPELGLYDNRNRFMSPDLGRFLQPDPIGFKGDASNLYRYCGNDWASVIDPIGTEGWRDYPKIGAVVHFNPVAISVIRNIKNRAWEEGMRAQNREDARARRDRRDAKPDVANAVRHVYGSAELTRQFGADVAKQITDIHEQHAHDKQDSSVDQYHNRIGREIGPSAESEKDVRMQVRQLEKEGKLIEDMKNDKRDRGKQKAGNGTLMNTAPGTLGGTAIIWGNQPDGGFRDAPGSNINLGGDSSPAFPSLVAPEK